MPPPQVDIVPPLQVDSFNLSPTIKIAIMPSPKVDVMLPMQDNIGPIQRSRLSLLASRTSVASQRKPRATSPGQFVLPLHVTFSGHLCSWVDFGPLLDLP